MTSKRLRYLAWVLAAVVMSAASADEQRASVNYKIHCQGCHLADAAGLADEVPGMKDFVGYFAHSQEGREFLVRVPGVATAALPDDQLAELLNWLLVHFSAAELPAGFVPFTVAEVAALRLDLVQDPATSRKRILREIADKEPSLANLIGEQGGR